MNGIHHLLLVETENSQPESPPFYWETMLDDRIQNGRQNQKILGLEKFPFTK